MIKLQIRKLPSILFIILCLSSTKTLALCPNGIQHFITAVYEDYYQWVYTYADGSPIYGEGGQICLTPYIGDPGLQCETGQSIDDSGICIDNPPPIDPPVTPPTTPPPPDSPPPIDPPPGDCPTGYSLDDGLCSKLCFSATQCETVEDETVCVSYEDTVIYPEQCPPPEYYEPPGDFPPGDTPPGDTPPGDTPPSEPPTDQIPDCNTLSCPTDSGKACIHDGEISTLICTIPLPPPDVPPIDPPSDPPANPPPGDNPPSEPPSDPPANPPPGDNPPSEPPSDPPANPPGGGGTPPPGDEPPDDGTPTEPPTEPCDPLVTICDDIPTPCDPFIQECPDIPIDLEPCQDIVDFCTPSGYCQGGFSPELVPICDPIIPPPDEPPPDPEPPSDPEPPPDDEPPCDPLVETCSPEPFQCPDGSSVPSGSPCPPASDICPDGSSVPTGTTCPPALVPCPDGSTVPAGMLCPPENCPDGSPVVGGECPCDPSTESCPTVQIPCDELSQTVQCDGDPINCAILEELHTANCLNEEKFEIVIKAAEFNPVSSLLALNEDEYTDTEINLADELDFSGYGWGSSCPVPKTYHLGVVGSMTLDLAVFCSIAEIIGVLVMFTATAISLRILFR